MPRANDYTYRKDGCRWVSYGNGEDESLDNLSLVAGLSEHNFIVRIGVWDIEYECFECVDVLCLVKG